MDASTPLDAKSVPMSLVAEGPRFPMRGPILAISALPNNRYKVEVAGGGFADERILVLTAPPNEPLPIRLHEVVEVRIDEGRLLQVLDASGALLTMMFAGDVEVGDWSAGDRGGPSECYVAVHHDHACAFVPSGTWRRLDTADGSWAIYATCGGEKEHTTVRVTRIRR
jgi:hypothetical protein